MKTIVYNYEIEEIDGKFHLRLYSILRRNEHPDSPVHKPLIFDTLEDASKWALEIKKREDEKRPKQVNSEVKMPRFLNDEEQYERNIIRWKKQGF